MRAFLLTLFMLATLYAQSNTTTWLSDERYLSKSQKVWATNVAVGSGIVAWGLANWEYFQDNPKTEKEGWFERNTYNGGSDKLGHFYTNYIVTHGTASLYEAYGYERNTAANLALMSSLIYAGLIMELGDSTSPEYGFSFEDLMMDTLGSVVGWLWWRNPTLMEKIDFRIEFIPKFDERDTSDFVTNYDSMKHLMAFKASGFELFDDTLMQYLELHVGYYSRDFQNDSPYEKRKRWLYGGVGINLAHLLRPYAPTLSRFFNYYQMPYTYVQHAHDFDKK